VGDRAGWNGYRAPVQNRYCLSEKASQLANSPFSRIFIGLQPQYPNKLE
jgi:hypothetical protein